MPIPKSPEEIMKEFDMRWLRAVTKKDMESCKQWLRESLASYAFFLAEQLPDQERIKHTNPSWYAEEFLRGEEVGRNDTINECKSILRSEAEELMKGV